MERRPVRFHDYDAVLDDAEFLLRGGYDRVGNWSLGQICHHLAIVMEMSLTGFPGRFPWLIRFFARRFVLPRILRHEMLRRRYPAPKFVVAPESIDDRGGVERLSAALAGLKSYTGEIKPSPVFGRLTAEQAREFHLWHCEHHLGFLQPLTKSPA